MCVWRLEEEEGMTVDLAQPLTHLGDALHSFPPSSMQGAGHL